MNIPPDDPIDLAPIGSWPASRHRFDEKSWSAVEAAIVSGRPLLLRGEPGIGKSQLARAVATALEVPFLYTVLDERTERDDLFYQYDAIARLAEAQVSGLLAQNDELKGSWREHLAERNFIRPGVLWWAFDWAGAVDQAKRFSDTTNRQPKSWDAPPGWSPTGDAKCGPVVLVDEIDKTDPSVPNGLLEGLGNQGFQTDQLGEAIRLPEGGRAPLIFITTNEERELPAAFVRRCLVLRMDFPPDGEAADFLIQRARVHCLADAVSDDLCRVIAVRLLEDRKAARANGVPEPGAAEYLDLIRIIAPLPPGVQAERWEALSEFTFRKHAEPRR